jgi:hypothetical protein
MRDTGNVEGSAYPIADWEGRLDDRGAECRGQPAVLSIWYVCCLVLSILDYYLSVAFTYPTPLFAVYMSRVVATHIHIPKKTPLT